MQLILVVFLLVNFSSNLDNGLALVPPKGFLTWQYLRCNVDCALFPDNCLNEAFMLKTINFMVKSGLRDAGYEYIVIDDCWMERSRDSNESLVADRKRFPHGIKALADYAHKNGMKFGIYEDMGTYTCQRYPGSLLHLEQDAETFASWGVDYLKMDGCYSTREFYNLGYPLMSKYLNQTGRPILFACSWPDYMSTPNYTEVARYCNIWRNAHDMEDSWESVKTVIQDYSKNKGNFIDVSAPGQFNDPDMILTGSFGLSYEAQKTQLIMWTMFAAPLMISADPMRLTPDLISLLTNKHILSLDNDPLGKSAQLYYSKGNDFVFIKELSGNRFAFAFISFSEGGGYYPFTIKLKMPRGQSFRVNELTSNEKLGHFNNGDDFSVTLCPYCSYAVIFTPEFLTTYLLEINFND